MRTLLLLFFCIFLVSASAADNKKTNTKLTGVIYENVKGYKLPLSLASVKCEGTVIGTFSDKSGEFQIDLPEGKHKITFSFVGYEPIEKELKVKKNKEIYMEVTLNQQSGFAQK